MAKTNQPGLVDKHLEKIVLGAAGLILVIVLVRWVVSSPQKGRILSDEPVPITLIDQNLKELADRTARHIDNVPTPEYRVPQWVSLLEQRMAAPLAVDSLALLNLTEGQRALRVRTGAALDRKLQGLPPVPALSKPSVKVASVLVQRPAMTGIMAQDVNVAHVTAVLDYDRLVKDWRDSMKDIGVALEVMFLRVRAERQELLPDGTWSEPVEVAGVSAASSQGFMGGYGGMSAAGAVPPYPTGSTVEEVLRALDAFRQRGVQQAVLQPEFYAVYWPNEEWGTWRFNLPITPVNLLETAIVPLEHAPPVLPEPEPITPVAPTPVPRRTTAAPGTGGPPPGYGGPGMSGPPPGYGGPGSMGPPPGYGGPGMSGPPTAPRPTTPRPTTPVRPITRPPVDMPPVTPVPPLAQQCEAGIVQVWLHDDTLENDKIYRYRLRLDIFNPVFGEPNLVANRADAMQISLVSESDWSDAAQVQPATQFFVAGGAQQTGRITFDVYRLAMGQVQRERFIVTRGGPIGGVVNRRYLDPISGQMLEGDIDFSTGAILVDHDFGVSRPGSFGGTTEAMVLTGDGQLVRRHEYDDNRDAVQRDLRTRASSADRAVSGLMTP